MMETKACTKCGETKVLSAFGKQGAPRTDLKTICKECDALYKRGWNAANKEKRRERDKKWRKANKEKVAAQDARRYAKNTARILARCKRYRATHSEETAASAKQWDIDNAAKRVAMAGDRRAKKRNATPKWANKFFIDEIYDLARRRTKATGFKWHVDHIVPLKHPLVQGLHVEFNLQVIPASENSRKKNYYWPNMP